MPNHASDEFPMKKILIVEDNDKNMKLARDILQAKGYTTLEAVTGEEGVQVALAQFPDLVLMDIQLPGISGIEAFRQIRGDPRTAEIPVIAFTASVTPTDRSHVTAAGFDAFLSKPIDLKEFVATIKRLADGRTP
jgi:two-component system, cell cycle response regulator DivK